MIVFLLLGLGNAQIEFVAYGDWGYDSQELRDTVDSVNRVSPHRDFNVLLGDNFYPKGVVSVDDPKFSTFTDIVLPQLVHHVLLGNHDYMGNVSAQILYTNKYWDLPHAYYKRTYSMKGVDLCLIFIDTIHWDKTQIEWIETQLAECSSQQNSWTIVAGHYPIWSAAIYSDDARLIKDLVPLLHKYGVQLYLCGHEHNHGIYSDGKIIQVLSGAAAASRGAIDFKPHNMQIWGLSGKDTTGYIRLFVTADSVTVAITSALSDSDFQSFTVTRDGTTSSIFGHIKWSPENSNLDARIAHQPRDASKSSFTTTKVATLMAALTILPFLLGSL